MSKSRTKSILDVDLDPGGLGLTQLLLDVFQAADQSALLRLLLLQLVVLVEQRRHQTAALRLHLKPTEPQCAQLLLQSVHLGLQSLLASSTIDTRKTHTKDQVTCP